MGLIVPLYVCFAAVRPWIVRGHGYRALGIALILATGAAGAWGDVLGLVLSHHMPAPVRGGILGYLLFGAIVALVQWPLLRREIPHLLVWIIASAIGWTAGFWASQAVLTLFYNGSLIAPAVSTTVIAVTSGLVAGAITGLALVWIVRKPDVV